MKHADLPPLRFLRSITDPLPTDSAKLPGGWGEVRPGQREWEEAYRQRWQHDRVVRSTHGVNCTGSCSWKVHVKNGIVVWETQQVDYPSCGPDMPDHEPRGCPRQLHRELRARRCVSGDTSRS